MNFGVGGELLEPIPCWYLALGESKVMWEFSMAWGLSSLTPKFKDQVYFDNHP